MRMIRNDISVTYSPNRPNQFRWGLILMAIGVFGFVFCWFIHNYGNIPYMGDSIMIMVSGGALLLGVLALVGRVEMQVGDDILSKRLSIAGIQVFEFSFQRDEISDVRVEDGCDLHFKLMDGRVCAFDNLNKGDAEELFGMLRPEILSRNEVERADRVDRTP